jgi:hypothetical protein
VGGHFPKISMEDNAQYEKPKRELNIVGTFEFLGDVLSGKLPELELIELLEKIRHEKVLPLLI